MQRRRGPSAGRSGPSLGAVLGAVVVLAVAGLGGCGWGVAEPAASVDGRAGPRATSSTAPVLRYVPAPTAASATALPDPRCRAARRLFMRAAVAAEPRPFVVDADTERLLDQVEVLATGDVRSDLAGIRDLVERFERAPASLTETDLEQSAARMDRLLLWTATACPPPQRPVWACSTQVAYGRPDPLDGRQFLTIGQIVPDAAVNDVVGEVPGHRIELTRSANRVVFGWVDPFGLVRRRVEVRRVLEMWFVVDTRQCDDGVEPAHPLDTGEVIVEELPDAGDGPEYATTTTTTTTTMPLPVEVSTPTGGPGTSVPLQPCRYDPNDRTDQYETLGDYMANGPADTGCWSRLTPTGRDCLNDPPSGEFFACFDM